MIPVPPKNRSMDAQASLPWAMASMMVEGPCHGISPGKNSPLQRGQIALIHMDRPVFPPFQIYRSGIRGLTDRHDQGIKAQEHTRCRRSGTGAGLPLASASPSLIRMQVA